jgi:hypothetical protein
MQILSAVAATYITTPVMRRSARIAEIDYDMRQHTDAIAMATFRQGMLGENHHEAISHHKLCIEILRAERAAL